ncbi:MAG: hypothetical protein EBE86_033685 [Hormoscilla sp. GUM202]|nr:hypothetical protein [Hormoscilla sp. GUM202]
MGFNDSWLQNLPEKFLCVDPESIKRQLESVLKDYPTLNPHGFVSASVAFGKAPQETDLKPSDFLKDADIYIPTIILCRQWLQDHQFRQTFNKAHSSYGYKHMVERRTNTYITNGAFIAAALTLDIPVKQCHPDSPNVYLPISEKSLTKEDLSAW